MMTKARALLRLSVACAASLAMSRKSSPDPRRRLRWGAPAVALAAVLVGGALLAPAGARERVWNGNEAAAPQRLADVTTVSPVASRVDIDAADVAGLDSMEASAGTYLSHVEGTSVGAPWVCVSAHRSKIRTGVRGGVQVDVRIDRGVFGCRNSFTAYRFDPLTWHAGATGRIPTELTARRYERGRDGWKLVHARESRSSATVDLTWQGVGRERVDPWLVLPHICYALPPAGPVCFGAGVRVSRDAIVQGSVEFEGLNATVALPSGQTGAMRWWAGK